MPAPALAEWRFVGSVFVFYGNGGEFCGEPLTAWRVAIARRGFTKYLGATGDRFRLSGVVRNDNRQPFLERNIPFATVTDDRLVRGMVTAGSWFGMNIAAFSWSDVDRAIAWLGVDQLQAERVRAAVFELRDTVEQRLAKREFGYTIE